MKKWIAILLLCLPTISLAATTQVNASWTRPTQRTDASALSTSEIKLYKVQIYDGSCIPETPADEAAIIAGTGAVAGASAQSVASASGVEVTDAFTGLTLGTQYRLYWVAENTINNETTQATYVGFTTTGGTLPALPEGAGISGSYPNDSGITAHSDVLFADDFESYTTAAELTTNWTNYYGNVVIDDATAYGGSKSLRIRMPATGSSTYAALDKTLAITQDVLHIRACVKFQSDYAGLGSGHNGFEVSASYPGPGTPPDGQDFYLADYEHSNVTSGEAEPGYHRIYVYHPEQNDNYGDHWYQDGTVTPPGGQGFGPDFVSRTKTVPARGEWLCHEQMVQANTPGSRDGRVAVWENGVLIADFPNLRFRDIAGLKTDHIALTNGGQSSSQQNDKHYDNVVVATSYIGPMSTGGTAPPNPITGLSVVGFE